MGLLGRVRHTPPQGLVTLVLESVREFSPGTDIDDDMTMVVVCRNGEGA
jgi:serine phosphatase RsbU (regulator of sigma subunit)